MVNVTIDGVPIGIEQGFEFIIDGGEEFNLGVMKIVNTSRRETYPDAASVIITINSVIYEAIIQKDTSTRTAIGIYEHNIVLAEPVMKLSLYAMADRNYTTVDGLAITYLDQANNILSTHDLPNTSPFTIHADTQALLDKGIAAWKEYTGGTLMTTFTEMFRAIGAVPTLSLNNVIGHELFSEQGNPVTFTNIIGEVLESDIADYGLAVHSKLKNASYEEDLDIGTTYYPKKGYGVTPRSSENKYTDAAAEWFLDSGIRRIPEAIIYNLSDSGTGFVEADISQWIVSKAEWDDLIIERDVTLLLLGTFKNNTLYFTEGDYKLQNAGVNYQNTSATIDALEALSKSYWMREEGNTAKWTPQVRRDIEIGFKYEPTRDMDVRVERHSIDKVNKNATLINNQKDSLLELKRNGDALKSLINRVGNDTYEVTIKYSDLVPFTIETLNNYDSNGYKIVKIHILTRNGSMDVIYKLTKNQSILNPLTAINRDVSPFTITKRNTLSCFVINSYVMIGGSVPVNSSNLSSNARKSLFNAFDYDALYDKPIYNAVFKRTGGVQHINMSVQKFVQGNALVFNAQFQHPKIAGYQLEADAVGTKLTPVTYADEYGQVSGMELRFDNGQTPPADEYPVGITAVSDIINATNYTIGLNPDEIFSVSRIIHLITDRSNLVIGDHLMTNNSLVKELGGIQQLSVRYYDGAVKHTELDKFAKDSHEGTGNFSIDATYETITITGVPSGKSWALFKTTGNHNLALSYNYDGTDLFTMDIADLATRPLIEVL